VQQGDKIFEKTKPLDATCKND